jgi:hypothetical protein
VRPSYIDRDHGGKWRRVQDIFRLAEGGKQTPVMRAGNMRQRQHDFFLSHRKLSGMVRDVPSPLPEHHH